MVLCLFQQRFQVITDRSLPTMVIARTVLLFAHAFKRTPSAHASDSGIDSGSESTQFAGALRPDGNWWREHIRTAAATTLRINTENPGQVSGRPDIQSE